MGEQRVSMLKQGKAMHKFVRHLLRDVQALQYMLDNKWFETGITRIGAEQELCLIDKQCKPATVAMEVLEKVNEPWLETELAKFNLETNLTPREFSGTCFSELEAEVRSYLQTIQGVLDEMDSNLLLTGILPTFKKTDLDFHNLTPKKRYKALMDALREMRGEAYQLTISGIDELKIKHDTALLEACNTSFQVHLQVDPDNFVKMYNIAQAVTAPIIAMAANSPILFGKRLWHETRIAVFQQSIDNRLALDYIRDQSPRVTFGNDWIKDSILDIYKDDIVRFRVILSSDIEEDALDKIEAEEVPKLRALQVHNSTVYRWNRPCYGISDNGKPHLRIENRVLAAGPTVIDEVANAVFWIGLMKGMAAKYDDIRDHIGFEDVRDNFVKSCQMGIDSQFTWINDKKVNACDLVLNELLPIAREGLEANNIDAADIDRYLGIIEGRAKKHMNGARWMLRSYTKLAKETTKDEALSIMTSAIVDNQKKGIPVHEWEMPNVDDYSDYQTAKIRVEEVMETDLFTVRPDDILDLVSDMMDWQNIKYTPVEDDEGKLVGLVSSTPLLQYFSQHNKGDDAYGVVRDVMITQPLTVTPGTSITQAINMMEENEIGCLPVVNSEGQLLGIVSEKTFLKISRRLLNRLHKNLNV